MHNISKWLIRSSRLTWFDWILENCSCSSFSKAHFLLFLYGNPISVLKFLSMHFLIPIIIAWIYYSYDQTSLAVSSEKNSFHLTYFGNEIISIIAEEAFEYIQAPIIKVTAPQVPPPYSLVLENIYIPDEERIRDAVQKVMRYA